MTQIVPPAPESFGFAKRGSCSEAADYVWSDGGDGFPDSGLVTLWLKVC